MTQETAPSTTTLKALRDAHACTERYKVLRKGLGPKYGDYTPIPLTRILEINGLNDVLWALAIAVKGGKKILRLWAADCAEGKDGAVLRIYETAYPNDFRIRDCCWLLGMLLGAAWAAGEKWQTERLRRYLEGEL